jgi:hypothetical protein
MGIRVNSPGWRASPIGTRGISRDGSLDPLPGVPSEFLTEDARVSDEIVLEPAGTTRGGVVDADSALDVTSDVEPTRTALLAIRYPSGALTFHRPVESTVRTRGAGQVRFQVTIRQGRATRGIVGVAIKAIVIKVAKIAADRATSLLLPRLAAAVESELWRKRGLREGWLKLSKETLAADALESGEPVSSSRSLLFIHGTFCNTASAYRAVANSGFFERVKDVYADRIFGFDHFSVSRSPEENARMLLEALPPHTTTFDVVTHSRGGLVLRNIVEQTTQFGEFSRRFKLGRAVLVASPNDGTPLATRERWDETVGWVANLLEMFPDNPFTTGAAFVANGLVWIANHALGDLPGLHAMDGSGDFITTIQSPPGPPADAYSALVSNYQPSADVMRRLFDMGIDHFFASANDLVVPSEGGWRVGRRNGTSIPPARVGCFGPGGNLSPESVTHVNFFSHSATIDFLVNALLGRQQSLAAVDLRRNLPDHRLVQRGMSDAAPAAAGDRPVAARSNGSGDRAAPAAEGPLRVTVINGDLTFESAALLLGHYHATRLSGTESVMDRMIGGAMKESLEMGVYPVAIGSHKIFINARPDLRRGTFMPRPKAVIIVGLGDEGKLQAADLVQSVRLAVIAWAQRLAENKIVGSHGFELAATLLGSGGTGVTPGDAARLIAQGVYQANTALRSEHNGDNSWPYVSHLRLIELYLDRATEAWRALRLQEAATPGRFQIDDAVKPGTGFLRRPAESGYRGAEFDFIAVEAKPDKDGTPSISYTLDTKRARSEVRGQRAQSGLISELVATASNDQNRDEQVGRTLFDLLIPVELEAYLTGSAEMQIELDPQTAIIPWELLDTRSDSNSDDVPWSIRVKLLRKLRIQEFRQQVSDANADASVLVIGEPACPKEYPRLYGARAEALKVVECLTSDAALDKSVVTPLVSSDANQSGPNARTIVNALFEKPWRVIHVAGHGQPTQAGKPGGVVLSNGAFLGAAEIRSMRTVPELVFVNCCHLASADAEQLLNTQYDRAAFASGLAGELIAIGVRCVVAAGWAVDDEAASVFAEQFYASLLRGNRFIVAVGEARAAARDHNPNVNTWAAYQCYGDADWVLQRSAADPNAHTAARAEDFRDVASSMSLMLALERNVVKTKFQGADVKAQLEELRLLETLFAQKWGDIGAIAELFGQAFVEAEDVEAGMRWYERAVSAPDGKASIKAAEQLANVKGRLAWELVDEAMRHLEHMKEREKSSGRKPKTRTAARRARTQAERSLRQAVKRADRLVQDSLALLAKLMALEPTMERASLVGSAYKRRALVDGAAGRRDRVQLDLKRMKDNYERAHELGNKAAGSDIFYPVSNRLAAEVALNAGSRQWHSLDSEIRAIVQQSLDAKSASDPDFWSVVGRTELDQFEALAKRKLAAARDQLEKAYEDLHKRVTATRMWGSVYDTACLVLPNYASRAPAKEKAAAHELLTLLRTYAHPRDDAA